MGNYKYLLAPNNYSIAIAILNSIHLITVSASVAIPLVE